jgi:hypothetical protein
MLTAIYIQALLVDEELEVVGELDWAKGRP